ncbi:unnamed protein product, partial [Prorocentrum cordatum]
VPRHPKGDQGAGGAHALGRDAGGAAPGARRGARPGGRGPPQHRQLPGSGDRERALREPPLCARHRHERRDARHGLLREPARGHRHPEAGRVGGRDARAGPRGGRRVRGRAVVPHALRRAPGRHGAAAPLAPGSGRRGPVRERRAVAGRRAAPGHQHGARGLQRLHLRASWRSGASRGAARLRGWRRRSATAARPRRRGRHGGGRRAASAAPAVRVSPRGLRARGEAGDAVLPAEAGFEAEVVLDFPHRGAAKKWVLAARLPRGGGVAALAPRSKWCALCWPVVTACCALQQELEDALTRERVQYQHIEAALRLSRCGRRICAAADGGSVEDEQVRARIEGEMHPLKRELAVRLARRLGLSRPGAHEAHDPPEEPDGARKRQRTGGASGAEDAEGPRAPQGGTRTELRSAISDRLPEVLQVLHEAPSECWVLPPPPLDTALEL